MKIIAPEAPRNHQGFHPALDPEVPAVPKNPRHFRLEVPEAANHPFACIGPVMRADFGPSHIR